MAGTVINPDMVIGEGCIVNTLASVDHDCILYDYVHVAVEGHLLLGIMILLPVLLVPRAVGAVKMKGNPFFTKESPDLNEKILKFVIFRTMTNEKDKNSQLLPDDKRLNPYGRFLRYTSLDELPELFNILKGDMTK